MAGAYETLAADCDWGSTTTLTRLVCGSHLHVLCRPVAHAAEQAGGAFLCHPFLVHTAT